MTNQPTPAVCPETLVRICGGNKDFARRLLDKFKTLAPTQVAEIRTAFAKNDLDTVGNTAHSLKGASAVMGAVLISTTAASIEEQARFGDVGSITAHLEQLQSLIDQSQDVFL